MTEEEARQEQERDEVRAVVEGAGQGTAGSASPLESLPATDPLVRQGAQDELDLKKKYGRWLLWIMGAQLAIADFIFFMYAWRGVHWRVQSDVMNVWLGATVVEVVGIATVVTRSLFPRRDRSSDR